jgi:YD repeat-containing protein
MKTTFPLYAAFAAALFFITGCAKKDTTSIDGRVKTVTLVGNPDYITTFVYDAQNRLSSTESSTGHRSVIVYSPMQLTVFKYDSGATVANDTTVATLNSNGQIATVDDGTAYTYDSDGQMVKAENTGYTTVYTWSADNMVGEMTVAGTDTTRWGRTYLTNKPDYRAAIFAQGKQSKNLIGTETRTQSNGQVFTTTFTYEYDALGRVTKSTDVSNSGSTTINQFTYF